MNEGTRCTEENDKEKDKREVKETMIRPPDLR
jgi:hypothetical protein